MIGAIVFKIERDGNHHISLYRDNVILLLVRLSRILARSPRGSCFNLFRN